MPLQPYAAAIEQIAPYQPGKPIEELHRELGLTEIIKLASNENPLGCSPQAQQAAQRALLEMGRYPDGSGFQLKQAIMARFGVAANQITLGNGSNDLLEMVAHTFLGQGVSAIYSQYGFAIYALATQAAGATGIAVPAQDYGHDLAAIAQAMRPDTRVIYLANPNNPTGTWFEAAAFEQLMAQVPESVLVVLDEAYVEYFPENFDSLPLLGRYPNLLISRTFSKAYGLAALRVGFALASPQVTDWLNRIRQPFNVSSIGLAAAQAALQDNDFVEQTRQLNLTGMQQLATGLDALGLPYVPSRANFLMVNVGKGQGQTAYQALLQEGVIVRPLGGYALPDFVRISIGTAQENETCLAALAKVMPKLVTS